MSSFARALAAFCMLAVARPPEAAGQESAEGEVLVVFRPGRTAETARQALGRHNAGQTGVIGTAFRAKVLPLKGSDANGVMFDSVTIEAFDYAIGLKQRGVNIVAINASYGSTFYSSSVEHQRYRVEWSDSLEAGSWLPLGKPISGTGVPATVRDIGALHSSPRRFYRLGLLPE